MDCNIVSEKKGTKVPPVTSFLILFLGPYMLPIDPEILLNLIPGGGGTLRLAQKIGVNLANEIVMTGRTVLAEEMQVRGVVNYIYPRESFKENVTEFASNIANQLPDRLQTIKQLTQEAINGITPELQQQEAFALGKFYNSLEGQEKIQAFYNNSINKNQEKK